MPVMKSGRERLPIETFELEAAGLRYTATIGRFVDGRVGEIFLSNHKSGQRRHERQGRGDCLFDRVAVRRRRRNHPQGALQRQPRPPQRAAGRSARPPRRRPAFPSRRF
jgi:hypothetical protein